MAARTLRVFIADTIAPEGLEILQGQAGIQPVYRPGLGEAELREELRQADGVVIRSGVAMTAERLAEARQLRAIVRAGVGVDNVDIAAATRRGVVVMNTPGGNTTSTAEHTVAMLLALSRNIAPADASLRSGKWERGKFTGTQLAGKTLGVLGLGRIGAAVARRAAAFEMRVVGLDPFLTREKASQLGVELCEALDDVLRQSQFLTVHVPLSAETEGMIGPRELALLPRGARVVNCARGGIIDEAALAQAIQAGHIAGAAIDVYREEPPRDCPLIGLPGVLTTPHLAASTAEALVEVSCDAARQMADYLVRGQIRFAVNIPSLDKAEIERLRPYLDMAYRLGILHSQMDRGRLRRVRLRYEGEAAGMATQHLTAAFAAGLLESKLEEPINLVNAPLIAASRGIEFEEERLANAGDFRAVIHSQAETEDKAYTAAATLFGRQYLRLVRLGPYHLDCYLDGTMLIFSHRDVPGIIGAIGTTCGRHGVNIAAMTVGREHAGGEAIAVLNLDARPGEEVLREVRANPAITSVSTVTLPAAGVPPPWLPG